MAKVKKKTDNQKSRAKLLYWLPWTLIIIGTLGLVVSAVLVFRSPQPSNVAVDNAPSSAKPSQGEIDNYKVAPDLPRYISIPAIHVGKTRIFGLGIRDGKITSPNNIYDAGWYNNSAKPGQEGAMFIFGHVSSWTTNGIFHDLKKLKSGDQVTIARGDNKTLTYKVVKTKIYKADNVNMNEVLSPIVAGTKGLNLMTCTGQIVKGTSEFKERLVVFTEQS